MRYRKRWLFAAPALMLIAVIFIFSSQPYGKQDIRPWLSSNRLSDILASGLSGIQFRYDGQEISVQSIGALNVTEFLIRKSAHIILYFCLSSALLVALWMLLPWKKRTVAVFTLLLTFLLALADEYNQQFSELRNPSWLDAGLDLIGATAGVVVCTVILLFYRRKKLRQ